MMNVYLNVIAPTQAAAIAVSTMYLPFQDRPLPRLPAVRVGPCAIVGKEGLLAKVVQASLLLGVISPLRDARLAEEIGELVAALVLAKGFQAVMHPEQVPTVYGFQLCPAIEAIEGNHRLRVHKITYVADSHKGGLGQPSRVYRLPKPQEGHQGFEEIGIVQCFPDRQLYEVPQRVPVVLPYLLGPLPEHFIVGHEMKLFPEGITLIPPGVWVTLIEQYAPPELCSCRDS